MRTRLSVLRPVAAGAGGRGELPRPQLALGGLLDALGDSAHLVEVAPQGLLGCPLSGKLHELAEAHDCGQPQRGPLLQVDRTSDGGELACSDRTEVAPELKAQVAPELDAEGDVEASRIEGLLLGGQGVEHAAVQLARVGLAGHGDRGGGGEGRGDALAIRTARQDVSYAELAENVARCGNALLGLGIPRGARMLMMVLDGPVFFYLFWGAIKAGIVPVPVNTLLRGNKEKVTSDVTEILEKAGHTMGGFILPSACSIAPPAPPDNIKLAVEICRNFKP